MVITTYSSARREKDQTISKEQFIKRARTARTLRQDVLDILTKEHISPRRYYHSRENTNDPNDEDFDLSEILADEVENTNRIQNTKKLGKFTPDAALSIKREHEENVSKAESLIQEMMGILLKPKSRDFDTENKYLSDSIRRRDDTTPWDKNEARREKVKSFYNGNTSRSRLVHLDGFDDNKNDKEESKKEQNDYENEGRINNEIIPEFNSNISPPNFNNEIETSFEPHSETTRKTEELISDTKSAIQNTIDMLNELDMNDDEEHNDNKGEDKGSAENDTSYYQDNVEANSDESFFSEENVSLTFQQRTRQFVESLPPDFLETEDQYSNNNNEDLAIDFKTYNTYKENEQEMLRGRSPLHLDRMDEYIESGEAKNIFLVDCSTVLTI